MSRLAWGDKYVPCQHCKVTLVTLVSLVSLVSLVTVTNVTKVTNMTKAQPPCRDCAMARPASSIRANRLIIRVLCGCGMPQSLQAKGMIRINRVIPLLMVSANRTECGDPVQSRYGVGDLQPDSLAPFVSPVGVTALPNRQHWR